ncbi:MAG: hypothetical protein GXY76_03085 [Chloroflexi bacterium]|nr:hypothetical protein [Chloroflexota bacterium]
MMTPVVETIRVVQYGLGPIGSAVARHIAERPGLQLVGEVDIDPSKVGRDLGEVMGRGRSLGVKAAGALGEVGAKADVISHATSSYSDRFQPQIQELLAAGTTSSPPPKSFPSPGWLIPRRPPRSLPPRARRARSCWRRASPLAL